MGERGEQARRAGVRPANGLRPGQVAAAAGVNLETLRYYERRGLLDEPERTLGGHRSYPGAAVERLRFINALQRLGFTLEEIADLVQVCARTDGSRQDGELRTYAGMKLAEIKQRMDDLSAVRDTLRFASPAGVWTRWPTCRVRTFGWCREATAEPGRDLEAGHAASH